MIAFILNPSAFWQGDSGPDPLLMVNNGGVLKCGTASTYFYALLTLMVPAGLEQFFIELGTSALERTLPPDTVTTDIEKMYRLIKGYNAEILE